MSVTATSASARLSSAEAHRIALRDAEPMYRDLHLYRVEVLLDSDGWHVDFEFKDESARSGGPHYIIDSTDGKILQKRYDQ